MSTVRGVSGRTRPAPDIPSPYDAAAALERMLRALRAESGATRVSVGVHEPSTGMLIPFRQAVARTAEAVSEQLPVPLSSSPFLSAVVRDGRQLQARADGRRATGRDLARRGVRSAHGEPLIRDGEVIGVLTVEPAAAAAPHLLRKIAPRIALALAEAWNRRSEAHRLARAQVLLDLVESTATARSLDHLLATACRALTALDGVDRARVLLLEDGRLVPRAAHGRTDAVHALAAPLGRVPHVVGMLALDGTDAGNLADDVRRVAAAAAAAAHLTAAIEHMQGRRRPDLALPHPRPAPDPAAQPVH